MSSEKCPYDYIVVEGVIGVGKTSLCRLLANSFGGRCILEDFESNPFIEDFYRSPRENAFKTQLYFLISRFKILIRNILFITPVPFSYAFKKRFCRCL